MTTDTTDTDFTTIQALQVSPREILGRGERANLTRIYAAFAKQLSADVGTPAEARALVVLFHDHVHSGGSAYEWISNNLDSLRFVDPSITLPNGEEWNDRQLDKVFVNFFRHYHTLKHLSPFDPITAEAAW